MGLLSIVVWGAMTSLWAPVSFCPSLWDGVFFWFYNSVYILGRASCGPEESITLARKGQEEGPVIRLLRNQASLKPEPPLCLGCHIPVFFLSLQLSCNPPPAHNIPHAECQLSINKGTFLLCRNHSSCKIWNLWQLSLKMLDISPRFLRYTWWAPCVISV